MDILSLAQAKTQLRKTASTHGGEWVGPCPACGGRDRFHVWPDKVDSKRSERVGIYWCRSCGKAGDVVQFLVDFDGRSYPEAFAALGLEAPSVIPYKPPAVPGARRSPAPAAPCTLKNDVQAPQSDIWHQKTRALVDHAAKALLDNKYVLKWLKERGITKKQAAALKLGWLSEERFRQRSAYGLEEVLKDDGCTPKKLWIPSGLVIPMMACETVRRIRIRRFGDTEPRYYVLPGSAMSGMAYGLPQRAAVIVESELDAVMLAGQVGEFCGVVALGSASSKPDASMAELLRGCAVILVALDSDDAGAKACAWWQTEFPQARRWPVPMAKDPGDAFAAGVSMVKWIKAGLPAAWFFGPEPIGQVSSGGKAAEVRVESDESDSVLAGPVMELAELLRKHPVQLRVARDGSRVWVRENASWARNNWEVSRRISRLAYMSEVIEHLFALGFEVVDGKNIKKREEKENDNNRQGPTDSEGRQKQDEIPIQ
jgi:DNA primase